jgi:hypothetical protein
MGQFKPMVKMMTNEPSVILKLKKGGKVAAEKADGGFMPMASTQPVVPARGGMLPVARPMRPSLAARRRAMNPNLLMKKGGVTAAEVEKELKQHEAKPMTKAHKKASGGEIDRAETRTTLKNSVKPFAKTKMDASKKDKAHGTGEVKEGKPAGYKMGGTIEGNEKAFENTKMVSSKVNRASGTGGVKMGNAGGFKKGGKVPGIGNAIEHDGNWENRPANSAKPGVKNTKTGEVKEANAGGYKKGGATKKAYATGGQVVDDGKAVKMPRHFVSRPVANTMQSGTFAKGGKVEKEEKPNLRLVKTHTGPKGHIAKVYKDRDWDEHRVKFFSPSGEHMKEADYHTDDVSDAHDTAMSQVNKGYKRGGKAKMANGGSPKDTGYFSAYSPTRMAENLRAPRNPNYSEEAVSKAIASSNRSGRKIGGKEAKAIHKLLKGYQSGGSSGDPIIDRETRRMEAERASERAENERMRDTIFGAPKRAYEAVKGMFGSPTPPAGSVTKTEKSVTVTPGKKRGGRS